MTTPDIDRIAQPVPVEIKNWGTAAKPPVVRKTTVKTYTLDPASTIGNRNVQICDYEPNRLRMAITVVDAEVVILTDPPVKTPDPSTSSVAPQGGFLPPNVQGAPYQFFGPDAFWLNSSVAVTRVTVVKEYGS